MDASLFKFAKLTEALTMRHCGSSGNGGCKSLRFLGVLVCT